MYGHGISVRRVVTWASRPTVEKSGSGLPMSTANGQGPSQARLTSNQQGVAAKIEAAIFPECGLGQSLALGAERRCRGRLDPVVSLVGMRERPKACRETARPFTLKEPPSKNAQTHVSPQSGHPVTCSNSPDFLRFLLAGRERLQLGARFAGHDRRVSIRAKPS